MPPPVVKFDKPQLMEWAGNKITDHNRSDLQISVERIETSKRMANGTLRKYVVADKRTFGTSWDDLPHDAAWTVDGFWGGRQIEEFYNNNAGSFVLRLTMGDGTIESYTVVFTSFSKDILKRGEFDFWQVSVEMEEI